MTKRQLAKAARAYALANTFHSLGNADTDDGEVGVLVRDLAVEWSARELSKMGLQPCDLLSLQDCIDAARGVGRLIISSPRASLQGKAGCGILGNLRAEGSNE